MRRLLLVTILVFSGCLGTPPPPSPPSSDVRTYSTPTVIFETPRGSFAIEVFLSKAPVTSANFLQYVLSGYYNGTVFHRSVSKAANASCISILQGGGFVSDGRGGLRVRGPTLGPIPLERVPNTTHVEGAVAMARGQDRHSATTQFFIDVEDSTCLDRSADPYVVFGRVVDGMEVLRSIHNISTREWNTVKDVPSELVPINGWRISGFGSRVTLELLPFREGYTLDPRGNLSFPVVVKNVGEAPARVLLAVRTPPGLRGWSEASENPIVVAPKEWIPLIVYLKGEGAESGVAATFLEARDLGTGNSTNLTVPVRIKTLSGPSTDPDRYPLATLLYIGIYGNGAVFDKNIPNPPWPIRIFPSNRPPPPSPEPIQVYLGNSSPPPGWGEVIEGFRLGALGLRAEETRTVRIPPEQGYNDNSERIFEITVLSVKSSEG